MREDIQQEDKQAIKEAKHLICCTHINYINGYTNNVYMQIPTWVFIQKALQY